MTDVNIKKEYFTREKTEIAISERTGGSPGFSRDDCFIFDFKSLSKNDLASIINALEKWIINNYQSKLISKWNEEKCVNIVCFDSCYEKIEEIILNILSVIKNRNQKIKMEILIKEAEEKTKLLKEAKEKGEKVPRWVSGIGPYTCGEKREPELPDKKHSTLIEEYGFPQ